VLFRSAQPEKAGEKTVGIGKLLDRLPGGSGDGPATTGSVAKSKSAPPPGAPMMLVPKIVVPKGAGDATRANR
jgi:hypothetical protein